LDGLEGLRGLGSPSTVRTPCSPAGSRRRSLPCGQDVAIWRRSCVAGILTERGTRKPAGEFFAGAIGRDGLCLRETVPSQVPCIHLVIASLESEYQDVMSSTARKMEKVAERVNLTKETAMRHRRRSLLRPTFGMTQVFRSPFVGHRALNAGATTASSRHGSSKGVNPVWADASFHFQ